jgi:hypothetical protein
MHIILKELFCVEWEFNREMILDEDHAFTVEAYIGPIDNNCSECFSLIVCNEDYVRKAIKKDGRFYGLWHLITNSPTKDSISEFINSEINKLKGKEWNDFYQKLRLIGESEFEDYAG